MKEINKKIDIVTNNEKDTKQFAKNICKHFKKGDIVILSGELGSGKTKFVEGVLSYFDKQDEISSPTFTIVNEYDTHLCPIFHFDLYRLHQSQEFFDIGGDEYLEKGICLIEWGELIEDILDTNNIDYLKITFSRNYNSDNTSQRFIKISYSSERWNDYFENIKY